MPDNIKINESHNLRKLRQAKNLPLWALAVRTRASPTTLSAIEWWSYKPGVELQERIAAALGVNVVDIRPEVSHEQS
jgi:DNA-binding XRE family transcriptional regulator